MLDPPQELTFHDQYAFRPTGSATAALIAIVDNITELLRSGNDVVLLSLDFSKAFDRIRHKTLFEKFNKLGIDNRIYNWLISYFEDREHKTKFNGLVSNPKTINASVVQGSALGPSSFSVAASDLKPKNKCIIFHKFADDMNLITTIDNYDKIKEELEQVAFWALKNNLCLNKSKTKEIIFRRARLGQNIPPPTEGIERVSSLKILGVVMQSNLSMNNHIDALLLECINLLYPMNILRSHGMQQNGLYEVFRSKIISKITYASSSWWGLASHHDLDRINSFIKRSKKFNFYPKIGKMFEEICREADDRLFKKIQNNENHVLAHLQPEKKLLYYNLRKRSHSLNLPVKDNRNFVNRILFKDINSFSS